MNSFLPFLIVSFVVASVWTILSYRNGPSNQRGGGLLGGWVAAIAMTALWQAEAVPWLLLCINGILFMWLGAMVYLFIAAVAILRIRKPGYMAHLCCAVLSLVVNITGLLQFLWLATVSASGV